MLLSRVVAGMLSVGLMVLGAGWVSGQDYPNKPIRMMTATAGSGADLVARLIATGISGPLGQPVVVDNRPAIVLYENVAKAPPDGYNVGVGGTSAWIGPLLRKTPYDPVRDLSPICVTTRSVNVLATHPSLPVKSVKELIALAKARPGELNYGSGAAGGISHLAPELFKSMASVNIVNIPYTSVPQSVTALISGAVQLVITEADQVMPHVKSGKLNALAVTSLEPSVLTPGLPTMTASGLPGFETVTLQVVLAPAGIPATATNRLNQEIVRFLNRPEVKERFFNMGLEIVGNSPEAFAAIIKSDMVKWGKVIKDAGIKAE